MHITILAIGSRGDVQPCIALGQGLQAAGFNVLIASHAEFEPAIREQGLEFALVTDSFQELLSDDEGLRWMTSGNVIGYMRGMQRVIALIGAQVMRDFWTASQDAGALVSNFTPALSYPIARKLGLPLIQVYMQPVGFYPTKAFANACVNIALPPVPDWLKGAYNLLTYLVFGIAGLQLGPALFKVYRKVKALNPSVLSLFELMRSDMPVLYGHSPHVLPKPSDWPAWVHVTGYWFLDPPLEWQPPADLVDFLEAGPPPVYVGFGSMSHRDPERTGQIVLDALKQSGQRGLIATGWGGMSSTDLTDDVFKLESAPHGWLFPRMAAVVHHGGAGTTAAGLRAGVPSVIVPHFGDQPFWARQVEQLGVGPRPIPRNELTAERLGAAITTAVTDKDIQARAVSCTG